MTLPAFKLLAARPAAGGGGITFPITGVTGNNGGSRSPSFTLGTAPLENDILVVFTASTTAANMADISGWTNVLGSNADVEPSDTSMQGMMHYHRVTSDEAAASTVTWTLTNLYGANETHSCAVAVLRGVATTGELVGANSGSDAGDAATPWVIPTVTPTDDCQIIAGVAGDNTATQTTPGTHTLIANDTTYLSVYLYSDNDLGANGVATGTTDVTPSAGNEYVSIVACFAPA